MHCSCFLEIPTPFGGQTRVHVALAALHGNFDSHALLEKRIEYRAREGFDTVLQKKSKGRYIKDSKIGANVAPFVMGGTTCLFTY